MPEDKIYLDSIAQVNAYREDRPEYRGQIALTGRFLMHNPYNPSEETTLKHYATGGSFFVREANQHLYSLRENFLQFLLDQGHNASTIEDSVYVPIDISTEAPRGLEHLFKFPHFLKYWLDVGYPIDDPSHPCFTICPSRSSVTNLHPNASGRAMGTKFYEKALYESNRILVAFAQRIADNV